MDPTFRLRFWEDGGPPPHGGCQSTQGLLYVHFWLTIHEPLFATLAGWGVDLIYILVPGTSFCLVVAVLDFRTTKRSLLVYVRFDVGVSSKDL